jgi:hypothetical protein
MADDAGSLNIADGDPAGLIPFEIIEVVSRSANADLEPQYDQGPAAAAPI